MWIKGVLGLGFAAALVGAGWVATRSGAAGDPSAVELLNVSYDPTRELWQEVNARFAEAYSADHGVRVAIRQSHGGSSSQARSVIDGLPADVVTLALPSDTDAIRKAGLIDEGWEEQFPHGSLPYFSTIVFVVRKGNPKGVKDWTDLVQGDIAVITPSAKTSGNGKLSFLAAWGSVVLRGGSTEDAEKFVKELYRRVPVLDSGARGATTTFAQKGIGDVHLTWENEAQLEVRESKGELELVYPPISIRAEPKVAVVNANLKRRGTQDVAKAYLSFVYTAEIQEIVARHFYRPIDAEVLARHADTFPAIELFGIERVAASWDDANRRFFSSDGVFDRIYEPSDK
ncbi:MAG: sulfate ABC transporter substrate-binding protein [Planctomycetia bacterium]|nr:sulfate ABC transporter substrate-binding protein [Planctomycetia bacterium]